MKKRAAGTGRKQEKTPVGMSVAMQQLMLPLLLAMPESRRAYVAKQMRDAYDSATASTAKKKLMQLASWLDTNGEEGAAASLTSKAAVPLPVVLPDDPRVPARPLGAYDALARSGEKKSGRP